MCIRDRRFLRRVRTELKRIVQDKIRAGKIADIDGEQAISMPANGTDEPRFREAKDSGRRQHVQPGNQRFSPGDQLPKPGQGGGSMGTAPGDRAAEDDFRFVLSREEVLDLFLSLIHI